MRYPQNDLVLQRHHSDYHGFQVGDFVVEADAIPRYQFPKEIVGIRGRYKEDHIQLLDTYGKITPWLFAENFKKHYPKKETK